MKKIEIEYIEKLGPCGVGRSGRFYVMCDGKVSGPLFCEEVIGLVARLAMRADDAERFDLWMEPPEPDK